MKSLREKVLDAFNKDSVPIMEECLKEMDALELRLAEAEKLLCTGEIICKECTEPNYACVCPIAHFRLVSALDGKDKKAMRGEKEGKS